VGREICLAGCIGRAQKHRLEGNREQLAAPGKSKRKTRCVESASPAEYGAGLAFAISRGWLWRHESGT
jgi:hypothetical protein